MLADTSDGVKTFYQLLTPNTAFHKKHCLNLIIAAKLTFTQRETLVLVQCLSSMFPFWKATPLACIRSDPSERKGHTKGEQPMVYRPEVCLAKALLKTVWRTSCRESTFMIDFHSSQTDCSVVILLTRNCSHCGSLLSAGCLNYNGLCSCYLLHKRLTLVSFSMQIHQFHSPS